jgi:hypothetical protein
LFLIAVTATGRSARWISYWGRLAGAGGGGNTNTETNVESMETKEVAALPPGDNSLVKRLSRSANPKSMLELVEGVYNQDLLSKRLQGNTVKEALTITLLRQFRRKDPNFKPPAWMPKELLSLTVDRVCSRYNFSTW